MQRQQHGAGRFGIAELGDLDQPAIDRHEQARDLVIQRLFDRGAVEARLQRGRLIVELLDLLRQDLDLAGQGREVGLDRCRRRRQGKPALELGLARLETAKERAQTVGLLAHITRLCRQGLLRSHDIGCEVVGRAQQGDLVGGAAGGQDAAAGTALDARTGSFVVEVGIVRYQHRHLDGLSDQRRIGDDALAHHIGAAGRQDAVEQAAPGPIGDVGELRAQRVTHQELEVAGADDGRVAASLRVDLGPVDRNVEQQPILPERRQAPHHDVGQHDHEKDRRQADRRKSIDLEARLGPIARAHAGFRRVGRQIERAHGRKSEVSHIALDIS